MTNTSDLLRVLIFRVKTREGGFVRSILLNLKLIMLGNNSDGASDGQNQPVDQRFMMEAVSRQIQVLTRQMADMQEEMGEMRAGRDPRAFEGGRNQVALRQ